MEIPLRALLAVPLLALAALAPPPASGAVAVCVIDNVEIPDYPCVEYHDDAWDCGLLGPRCVCVMFYEDYGSYGSGRCVVLPAQS